MSDDLKNDRLAALLASDAIRKYKKKHGDNILTRASEVEIQTPVRMSSGIFSLDYALEGGWPAGYVNMVYGHKSSGKTTALLKTIATAQRRCASCWKYPISPGECVCGNYIEPVAAFIDVEGSLMLDWARQLGVDTEKMFLSRPDYAEMALDMMELILRTGNVDIVVLDSLAFLTPIKELEESVQKETMGQQAKILGRALRKLTSTLNGMGNVHGRRPTIFFTNQIRMKMVMFGNPETTPGGLATGFATATEVKFHATNSHYEFLDCDDGFRRPVHVDINFKIDKNKTGIPKTEGAFRLLLMDTETHEIGDIYDEKDIMNLADRKGVIVKKEKGSGWVCMGEPYATKIAIVDKLSADPAFKVELIDTICKSI